MQKLSWVFFIPKSKRRVNKESAISVHGGVVDRSGRSVAREGSDCTSPSAEHKSRPRNRASAVRVPLDRAKNAVLHQCCGCKDCNVC